MGEISVIADRVSKTYTLGKHPARATSMMELMRHGFRRGADTAVHQVRRALSPASSATLADPKPARIENGKTLNALREVSFQLTKGEVLGVIGRNGAGKSTLLKILSRITTPSEGCVRLRGRVGSLLEVGTGFHPELTGRENVYLNGSILGMQTQEITNCFSSIVDFADIGPFIDTPVKRYSSGMYVRLAFAIAVHVRPEILILDEVLSVGDVQFQRKCLGSIADVMREGRTVLLVSHSMSTVKALCTKVLLLDEGRVAAFGTPDDVIRKYLSNTALNPAIRTITKEDQVSEAGGIRVHEIRLLDAPGTAFSVCWKDPLSVQVRFQVLKPLKKVAFGAGVRGMDGTHILTVQHDDDSENELWDFEPGEYSLTFTLTNELRPGLYRLHIGADHEHNPRRNILALDVVNFEVLDFNHDGRIPYQSNTGLVNGSAHWNVPLRVTAPVE